MLAAIRSRLNRAIFRKNGDAQSSAVYGAMRDARRVSSAALNTSRVRFDPEQVLTDLNERGVIAACTRCVMSRRVYGLFLTILFSQELIHKCLKAPTTVYVGFDPTADSLHVGNLLLLTTLLRFHHYGHRCIAVVRSAPC